MFYLFALLLERIDSPQGPICVIILHIGFYMFKAIINIDIERDTLHFTPSIQMIIWIFSD